MNGEISRLSLRHGGHVSHRELLAAGHTKGAIRHQIQCGFLIPVHPGIYAVGRIPTRPLDRAAGALLAAGPGATLSHSSAAAIWGIESTWAAGAMEVTVPTRHRPPGLRVHRSTHLLPVDRIRVQGLWTTSRARTLLDMTPRIGDDEQLLRVLNRQRADFRLNPRFVEDVLARFPRHPGAKRLRAIVLGAPGEHYRSVWEIEWPPYALLHHLPAYVMNYVICGIRVDVFFVVEKVIVELDGWSTHGTRPAFEADRDRRNEILAETGIPTVALTHRQFHEDGPRQAARLHKILARRRRELGLPS